jgi:hypothetical protein
LKIFNLVLITLFLMSCGKKEDDSSDKKTVLEGTFKTACLDAGDGLFIMLEAIFSGSKATLNTTLHMNDGASTCNDASKVVKIEDISTLSVGEDYTDKVESGAHKAYEITFKTVSIKGTAYNNGTSDFVTAANNNTVGEECSEAGTWVDGEELDITGLKCFGDNEAQPSKGDTEYNFMDINTTVDPVVIKPGDVDIDDGLDGSTAAKRPVKISDITLTKQ